MEETAWDIILTELLEDFLSILDGLTIHNAWLICQVLHLDVIHYSPCQFWFFCRHDLIDEIGPVWWWLEVVAPCDLQSSSEIFEGFRRYSGWHAQHSYSWKKRPYFPQSCIIWSEIRAPFTDAVCFINHEKLYLSLLVQTLEYAHNILVHEEPFWRQKEKLREETVLTVFFDEAAIALHCSQVMQFCFLQAIPQQSLQWYKHDNALIL